MLTIQGNAPSLLDLFPPMANKEQSWHCFASPESLCSAIEASAGNNWCRAAFDYDTYFRATRDMDEAISLCREGWQDGATRAASLRDKIAASVPTQRRYVRYGVAGAIPDVPRYLAGNPQHMRRIDTANARQRPVITLVNHMGGLASVKAQNFLNKAGAVAAIADSIESAGYSCHVIGLSMVTNAPNNVGGLVGVAVTIKEAGQSLDIGRMAFAIGHVAMLRRMVFAIRGSDSRNKPLLGESMGTTADFKDTAPNTYILPSMNTNADLFATEESTVSRGVPDLVSRLRAQGCPAFRDDAMAA